MRPLDEAFAPVREHSHLVAMLSVRHGSTRAEQIACITAIMEGTIAAAVQIFGAESAFNVIQPLVDKALCQALVAQ